MNNTVQSKKKKYSKSHETWRRFKKNRTAVIGLVILVIFVLVAVFADVIIPYETALEQTIDMKEGPTTDHLLGTDKLGRDVLARIVHGCRNSMKIGLIGAAIATVIGLILGSITGYYGGKLDDVLMRFMDMLMCIPQMLLALAIVAALGANVPNLIIALALSSIPSHTRANRALVMQVADNEFVRAAKSYGANNTRIIFKYLVPNIIGPFIVSATMSISTTIISAAALSFLGMGVQPPNPEWGMMLSEGREVMSVAPHLVIIPGITILLLALSFNLVGDGLQDALNPRLKD